MNIKRLPSRIVLSFTSALMLCLVPHSASAQSGNQSDVTGAIVTTSDIISGSFSFNGLDVKGISSANSNITNSTLTPQTRRRKGIRVVFAKLAVEDAIKQSALKILNQLNINSLTSITGNPIPSKTQQTLLSVLTESGSLTISAGSRKITNALSGVQSDPTVNQAQQLTNNLRGLLKTSRANKMKLANNRVDPIQLFNTVKAYNNLIDNSSAHFLNNPPPELIAIQSVLSQLINSALSKRH